MCDDLTDADIQKATARTRASAALSRRGVGLLAGAAGLTAALPVRAASHAIRQGDVRIAMPDGRFAEAHVAAPAKGRHPAVIVWPDIWGLRPAMRAMGARLAEQGYAVLTINPFWRSGTASDTALDQKDEAARGKIGPMRALLTPEAVAADTTAMLAFLDQHAQVDTRRGAGAIGYCMGGPFTVRAAAAAPHRVRAAASFHGGGLLTAEPTSPHLLLPKTRASYLVAIADNDHQRRPEERDQLKAAFAAAGRPAEVEVYEGALHGWTVTDSAAFNAPAADLAFARLLALFGTALA